MTPTLENNIRIYPAYQVASSFLSWLPLFFLYFNQYVSLSDALVVSSVYYFSVFVLEVPSGYFSDRFGRKPVMLVASICAVISYTLFLFASDFQMLVIAQFFLAGFFSLKSGSDSALLYDSLQQLGKQDDYTSHEARSAKLSMLSMAVAGLLGGITGYFNLHIPYVMSLAGALISLIICYHFVEPNQQEQAVSFKQQLKLCIKYLNNPLLLWIFAYFVFGYSLEHMPAEFNQPYIKLLQNSWFGNTDTSAVVSGVVLSVSMLSGAIGAAISIQLQAKIGLRWLFMVSLLIQTTIIAALAIMLHPLILLLVMLRNFSMALTQAPMLGAIAPHVASAQRATYLSIQSLAGRLGFSIVLFALARLTYFGPTSSVEMTWPQLSFLLRVSLGFAVLALLVIYFSSRKINIK